MDVRRGEATFTIAGFCNWKDGTVGIINKTSVSHTEAMEVMVTIPSRCPDVAEMLSKEHATQKQQNNAFLKKFLANLHFFE